MTYTERIQKESKELAAVFIAEGLATPVCGEDCIRLEKSLEPIVIRLLAKQAEIAEDAHRVGYICKAEGDNIGLSRKTYLIETGLVPQIDTDEITK